VKLVTYLSSSEQLEKLDPGLTSDVVIAPKLTSRFGELSWDEALDLAQESRDRGFSTVLEWDVLQTQQDFSNTIRLLSQKDMSVFEAIRVQGPGALNWVRENLPEHAIQLVLETGNHNLVGLKRWRELAGPKLERLVLSLELSKDKLAKYIKALDVPIELLGLGRILLFYTPRKLLSAQFIDHDDPETIRYHEKPKLEVAGSSEESPHRGFPIVENQHGTFMFNTKDHGLLENLSELQEMGLAFLRVDLRFADFMLWTLIEEFVRTRDLEYLQKIKTSYPAKTIKGYYNTNRTTRLFPKLKNARIQKRDQSFAAEVIDALKESHLGLMAKNPKRAVRRGDLLKLLAPDGREKSLRLTVLRNSVGEEVEQASEGELFFIPWVSGMNVKSMVFWASES
jgi:putative protease